MLSWRYFVVLLWFFHAEYAFIYAVRDQVYFLFHRNIQLTQEQLLKETLPHSSAVSLDRTCEGLSFYSIMFHLSYPIQCQYYNLYITIALKWTLISSRPNTLKFVFNIFVLFLALSISIINLRICHIPHKVCWYLVEIAWTFKNCIFIET